MSIRGHWTYDKDGTLIEYVPERPKNRAPAVHTDECCIRSMADRKTYTSKAKLRRSYRELGFVEVGNDPMPETPREHPVTDERHMERLEEDITKAYYQCRDGMAPLSELDKERCKIVDKQFEESHDNRERDFLGNIIG